MLLLGEKSTASQSGTALEQTILREGEWKHPKAPGGVLKVDKGLLDELQRNFDAGVGLADNRIPAHIGHTEHINDRAAAWAAVRVEPDPERPGKHRMVAMAQPTSNEYRDKVLSGEYAYVSPRIDFGYQDAETGKRHNAVLRNFAYTNYPYLKKMGAAKVVNLSEIAEAEGDTVELGNGFDLSGPTQGEPNFDGLPDGVKPEELPHQCMTCARLGNDCPFSSKDGKTDLSLKQAAAGAGNCPQYIQADSQTPGDGPAGEGSGQSPALGRGNGGQSQVTRFSEGDYPELGRTHVKVLRMLVNAGGSADAHKIRMAIHGPGPNARFPGVAPLNPDPGGHFEHLQKHGLIRASNSYDERPRLDDFGAGQFKITDRGRKALEQAPGATKLSENKTMPKYDLDTLRKRIALIEADEHKGFVTTLAETHALPADTMTAIDKAFKVGTAASVSLSEAIEGVSLTLSEEATPEAFEKVDLSEAVILPRKALRDLLTAVASSPRTELSLGDTVPVAGTKPGTKPVTLSEELASLSPEEAVKRVREAEKNKEI